MCGKNRSGECACTAYVTFKDAYAQETAVLLSVSFSLIAIAGYQMSCLLLWGGKFGLVIARIICVHSCPVSY